MRPDDAAAIAHALGFDVESAPQRVTSQAKPQAAVGPAPPGIGPPLDFREMIDGADGNGAYPIPQTRPAPAVVIPHRFLEASLAGDAILAHPFERPPSLLGGGIISAADMALMFGQAGIGKTWLAISLALAMASGKPWLGLETTGEPAAVGFLELELLGHAMQDRIRALGAAVPHSFNLLVRPALRGAVDLVTDDGVPAHLPELREWIDKLKLKIVFIDALARATSCSQMDFSPLLLALDTLRADTGAALALVHHEGKAPRDRGAEVSDLDAMRGDSRLSGFPQCVMRVLEAHGCPCIRFAKVSCAETPAPIYFRLSDAGVPEKCEPPEEAQREKGKATREKIARFILGAGRSVSRAEVAEAVELGRSAVTAHLNSLIRAGRIDSYGENKGTRYLPPTGATGDGEPVGDNGHD